MTTYALISPDLIVLKELSDVDPEVDTKPGYKWLVVQNDGVPSYDPHTQMPVGPFYEVHEEHVVKYWVIQDKTESQIRQEQLDVINSQHHVLLNALCDLHNRIRAQQGLQPETLDEYKEQLRPFV